MISYLMGVQKKKIYFTLIPIIENFVNSISSMHYSLLQIYNVYISNLQIFATRIIYIMEVLVESYL